MRAISEASSKADASRLRRRCTQLMAEAEKLKTAAAATGRETTSSTTQTLSLAEPAGSQNTPADAAILEQGSLVLGNLFPPWASPPSDAEFGASSQAKAYIDNKGLSLSVVQRESLRSWSRPNEALISHMLPALGPAAVSMQTGAECDLVQDVTTDCSVVASLSAAIKILTRRPHLALSTLFFPFDHAAGQPKVSKSGKYILRLQFNGCFRKVVIDDTLPASSTDRTIFVTDRCQPQLLWPALVEKAYLKVRGGYDFPGSNSGTDLWILIGWIPEQLFLQREDFHLEEVWARIKSAHESQNVIISLGTGQISGEEEQVTGLVGQHCYAVQAIREDNGSRQALVKNPWRNGPAWRVAGWAAPSTSYEADVTSFRKKQSPLDSSRDALWVSLEDIAQTFEFMYLNWSPSLFPHRQNTHFTWDIPQGCLANSLVNNPQFAFSSTRKTRAWILISRHFNDAEYQIAQLQSDSITEASNRLGFMSILIFDNDGKRTQLSTDDLIRGPYVDSQQTLAQFEACAEKPYTVVLDQHKLPLPRYSFTMSIFSDEPLSIQPAPERLPYIKEVSGAWTRNTAGGSAGRPTFFENPQYKFTVSRPGPISVMLSTDKNDIQTHVDLVWAGGERITSVRLRDIVASSGEYRRGCCVADSNRVEPGVYTVVCSTFEPGQTASFCLRISSGVPFQIEKLFDHTAGKLRTPLVPFHLTQGEQIRRAPLSVSRLLKASVGIHGVISEDGFSRSHNLSSIMIRVSVVYGWGSDEVVVATSGSGQFHEPTAALRTPEFNMEPDRIRREGLWLVFESMGTQTVAHAVEGDIYAESPVNVGPWEIMG